MLVFVHIQGRKVIVTKATLRPDHRWTGEAAECLGAEVEKMGPHRRTGIVRDNDSKFGE